MPAAEAAARPTLGKPLLASEALMEDLAPVEPMRNAARIWCAGLGIGFALFGGLPLAGLRPGGLPAALPSFVLGGIALVAALTRVSYRQRAFAMIVLGTLSGAVGLRGIGPAAGIAVGGETWGGFRLLAATLLPAALIFRSRYRAYAGARWLLALALAISVPFAVHAVLLVAGGGSTLGSVGGVLALLALVAGLSGFMGSETTGAGSYIGVGVQLTLAAELLLEALGAQPLGWLTLATNGTAAVAFVATCAIATLGIFQVLAWRLAADARRIDLHASIEPAPLSEPSGIYRKSSDDWSA